MAEQQRIHPMDVEAPLPSAPPATPSLAALEKSDSTGERPTIQVAPSRPLKKKRRSFCCCCCTLLAIVLLVLVVSATAGVLYVVFDPKIPKYSVDRLRVSGFSVRSDMTQQQQTGKIPLTVRGDVPVSVRVGKMKLWKMTFQIRCDLVVNSLSTSDDISVRSNSCQFKLKR
ncbi:unnamed protein product [Musa acuminata subsp. malaccensis]|uniref:(wild Malaysian banana) hypothetical protein n=1 Tax=Musa acuminata subsp. malaccensis TaxID=214687 RepID=A0A804HM07_MUSAM|nr:unnamed protein product [Musa acuminata subsp. malaccensis]